MFEKPNAPYLGVAYYPEDWPEEEMDKDIARMKEIGINTVRIAEFAWHRMEPAPGEFDFSFFHKVIDKCAEAGLAVVMGTPTATPPRWLSRLYPDVMMENMNGRQSVHGGRRHCCSNNIHYNEYSMRIVEEMAKEFANEPAIIGWQIDNEIYAWNGGCFCPDCQGKFRERMRKKFKKIDKLNEAWNLNLFSQWYDDFADIPAPRDAWHNPHLKMEWDMFQQDSHIAFVHRQADILHKYVKVPVGTDIMPVNGMDYRKLNEKLDIIQFNHYNTPEDLYRCVFWFDYLRTFKDKPFWNTETATCWNGSTAITQSIKPEGYCRVNSWLPIAMGGEANMYWLWRTHWAGHELTHGAVIDTSGRDMLTTGEVEDVAKGYAAAADFINNTKVKTDVAIHFTSMSWNMHAAQQIVQGWDYMSTVQDKFYKPMTKLGLRPDIIDAAHSLDEYKLIYSPMVMTLEDANLGERMAEWVKKGGTWVVGPLTDVRDINGARYRDRYYGMLEELTGVKFCYTAPDTEGRITARWNDVDAFKCGTWFEMCDTNGAEMLANVVTGHSAIEGKSVCAVAKVGEGRVIMLGTLPSGHAMRKLTAYACEQAGVVLPDVEGRIMVANRDDRGMILVEYAAKPAAINVEKPVRDLITGNEYKGRIELKPYDVMVLEYI